MIKPVEYEGTVELAEEAAGLIEQVVLAEEMVEAAKLTELVENEGYAVVQAEQMMEVAWLIEPGQSGGPGRIRNRRLSQIKRQ